MDIKKYIKNKDIELSNDDFNIDKLENDLRKGYVLSSEVDERKYQMQLKKHKVLLKLNTINLKVNLMKYKIA